MKAHCENYMALGEAKPSSSETQQRGSWWIGQSREAFAKEARKRYPETGAARVDRGKVMTYGPESATLGSRVSTRRRS